VPDYHNYQHVTLGDDRNKNTAGDIDGYPLDVQPDSRWPGTQADPSKARYNVQKMRDLADELDKAANDLSNVPTRLNEKAAKANFGPNTWYEANHLADASGQVLGAVVKYSQEILANLHAAATAIRTAADKYDNGEQANQQSFANQQASLPNSGGTQTAPY
jgi:hypothetical protein